MSPERIPSVAIAASAGCGKTEEMALRLLGMLLQRPEEMAKSCVTMTFTKAAAGEIYFRLLSLLYDSLRKQRCDLLNFRLSQLGFALAEQSEADFLQLLKRLIGWMNQLKISTIDSFMNSIVQSFPLELGLPGSATLIDEGESALRKDELLRRLFARAGTGSDSDSFVESCKASAYGNEKRQFFDFATELLENTGRSFRENPLESAWEYFTRFQETAAESLELALYFCQNYPDWPEEYSRSARDRESLEITLEHAAHATRETRFTARELRVLRLFYASWDDFISGNEKPDSFKKNYIFTLHLRQAIGIIFGHARNILIYQAGIRTAAMRRLYAAYDRLDGEEIALNGRITFDDLVKLLVNDANEWTWDIAYRLNGRLKHWLIDEFQDTSRDQWAVMARIIDLPDPFDDRSLFLVGDVKQAIYGWRAGDRHLMGEVIEEYREVLGLSVAHKDESFRYGASICEGLNRIFGKKSLEESALFPSCRRAWEEIYEMHRPAEVLKHRSVFEVLALGTGGEEEEEELFSRDARLILEQLDRLDFRGKPFSAAILVRGRNDALKLKEMLSMNPDWRDRFVWEGDETIGSDKLVISLVSLLVYLHHPGDGIAREIVEMSLPVRHLLPRTHDEFCDMTEMLANQGFYAFLRFALDSLIAKSIARDEDPSERDCWLENSGILLETALDYDRSGQPCDALRFRDFVNLRKKSDTALQNKIKIMTIHHSKGLTFDVVFVPVFNNIRHGNLRKVSLQDFVSPSSREWVLYQPREEGWTVPEIRRALEERHANDVFEELCNQYVALSRAKYGLYVLLPPLSKKKRQALEKGSVHLIAELEDESYYASDFLYDAVFGDGGGTFDSLRNVRCFRWGETTDIRYQAAAPGLSASSFFLQSRPFRRRRLNPSESRPKVLHFELAKPHQGSDLGTEIHRFFETIADWGRFTPPAGTAEVILNHYRACRMNDEVVKLLSVSPGEKIWLEKSFEVILDQVWLSGCFDRVNLFYDSQDRVERAEIIDYKSNMVTSIGDCQEASQEYRGQLREYRRALGVLLKLPEEKISAFLLFTRLGFLLPMGGQNG